MAATSVSLFAAPQQGTPIAWGTGDLQTNVPPGLTNIIAVAAGQYHNLALRADGTVAGWGDTSIGRATPPTGLNDAVAVSAGFLHSLVLRANGRVVAFGDNSGGQTNIPAGLVNVKAISAGQYHNLALRSNGTVVAWGGNYALQTDVPANLVAVAVAAGGSHSLALRTDGTVAGWGANTYGQANTAGLNGIVAITAGDDFSLALRSDGSIVAWGNPAQNRTSPPALTGVRKISAGVAHSLALKNNGTVAAWGDNTSGQLDIPSNLRHVIDIGAGYGHSLALFVTPPSIVSQPMSEAVMAGANVTFSVGANGSAPLSFRWRKNGVNLSNQTSASLAINNAQTNDAGSYSVVITNSAGSVTSMVATLIVNARPTITTDPQGGTFAVGSNIVLSVTASGTAPLRYSWRHDGTNLPDATTSSLTITNLRQTHAGSYVVIVSNNFGAVTSMTAVVIVKNPPIITSQPQSQTALAGAPVTFDVASTNADSYQWQKNGANLPGATGSSFAMASVRAADAGEYRVLLTNPYGSTLSDTATLTVVPRGTGQGEVIGWGESLTWNGSTYVDLTPPAISNVVAISAGAQHSLARFRNGTVLPWGLNNFGQLTMPTNVANVVEISAGGYHSLVRTASGSVIAWGRNDFLQSTVPALPTNIIALAAGGFHSLALKSDGTVVGWGKGSQSFPPFESGPLARVSAGTDHSLAVKTNSTVVGWGTNDSGQARPPANLSNVVAIAAGEHHSLALRSDGKVVAWGANNLGQTNVPSTLSNVIAIACGANHCLALTATRTVVAWGHNNFGQIEVPTNLLSVIAIAAGGDRSLALARSVLRLQPPFRNSDGVFNIAVGTTDGSAITSDRASKIQIYATTNPITPPSSWAKLTQPLTQTAGVWRFQDSPQHPARFYLALEPQ